MTWNTGTMAMALDHRPRESMSVDFAHKVMQRHIDCPITVCAVKRQARNILVDHKVMILDSGRARD